MQKSRIPYIPYRSLLLSTTILNDSNILSSGIDIYSSDLVICKDYDNFVLLWYFSCLEGSCSIYLLVFILNNRLHEERHVCFVKYKIIRKLEVNLECSLVRNCLFTKFAITKHSCYCGISKIMYSINLKHLYVTGFA